MPDTTVIELGRRERKKLETRRALASAALRLAAERGPDQVTIEDIADAADVSVRTFFNYFSSKEEAIIGWDPEGQASLVQRVIDRPAGEAPLVAVRNVFLAMVESTDVWADDRTLRHELVRQYPSLLPRHLAAHYELERSLMRAVATRLGVDADTTLLPLLVAAAAANAFRLSLTWWDSGGRTVPLEDVIREAFDAFERGLVPAERK